MILTKQKCEIEEAHDSSTLHWIQRPVIAEKFIDRSSRGAQATLVTLFSLNQGDPITRPKLFFSLVFAQRYFPSQVTPKVHTTRLLASLSLSLSLSFAPSDCSIGRGDEAHRGKAADDFGRVRVRFVEG